MADELEDDRGAVELMRLRRENRLLTTLLESVSELMVVMSADGTLGRTFRARGRPLGHAPEAIDGRNMLDLVHPEDAASAMATLARVVQTPGATQTAMLRLRRSDGTWTPMECTAENRYDDPLLQGIVVCARDVSERLELERKLQLSQRLESVGRVASGIVHDFNNLLSIVLFNVDRAQGPQRSRHDVSEALAEIARAARRGVSSTKRLLSFVRDRPARPRPVDLAEVVAAQELTLRGLLSNLVQLEVVSERASLPVVIDPAEMQHVLINLVLNARDALPHGGRIDIETRLGFREGSSPQACAIVEVRDDGQGMDDATRARAFEPFFTTKSTERGTGLGLWTVEDVVLRSGGMVSLVSEIGRGSTVSVSLPLAAPAAVSSRSKSMSVRRVPVVLIVDDELMLRELVSTTLEESGYVVNVASDGLEALELLRRSGLRPALLVTDLSMPRLGGVELAERLRAQWPGLPVLYVTGLGDTAHEFQEDDKTRLLTKPFTLGLLLNLVESLTALPATGSDQA